MRIAARRWLPVACVIGALAALGSFACGTASAEVTHKFDFSFNGSEAPGGPLRTQMGTIAVSQANGEVYVEEPERGIEYFDASGKYLGEITGASVPQGSLGLFYYLSGVAVDDSGGPNNGDVYVAGTSNGVVYRFDSAGKLLSELSGSGTPAGSFEPSGLAVDASGNLYVADLTNHVVDKFSATGTYLGQIASTQILNPGTIAVDSSGNVYLTNFSQNVIKLEPGGGSSVLVASKAMAVGVDPATGDVYVSQNFYPAPGLITEFNSAGERLGAFGQEQISSNVLGLAVQGATGEVYAADNNNALVEVFGPGLVIPDASTAEGSNPRPTSVTLHGAVNPAGLALSSCEFEYGESNSYGQTASCEQSLSSIGSGTSPVEVSANVTGLAPDTAYHFRLVASNENGSNHGADATVSTSGPPRVDGESASNVERTSATLEAQINPFGFETTYHFEYGTSTAYGTSVPVPDAVVGSGIGDVAKSQQISGLKSGVTYHYRVVATSSEGTIDGPDQTVTTIPPAYINIENVTGVASTSATLNAQVNVLGTESEYRIELGPSTAYGQTYTGMTGETMGELSIQRHVQELQPDTTYHYRILVKNTFGTSEGEDHTFITQRMLAPFVLPDGRGWELVSPPNKKAALIEQYGNVLGNNVKAAANGGAIVYETNDSLGEQAPIKQPHTPLISARGAGGWSTDNITIPVTLPNEEGVSDEAFGRTSRYTMFSADLLSGLAEQETEPVPALSPEARERTPYVRHVLGCDPRLESCFEPIITPSDVEPAGTKFGGSEKEVGEVVLGASPNLAHLVVQQFYGAPAALYEWSGGHLAPVSVLPDGEMTSGVLGRESNTGRLYAARTISSNGDRVVWATGRGQGQVYVREMEKKKTLQVGGGGAIFQTMSADGSRLFYTEAGNLYELNLETGLSSDLTAKHGAGEPNGGVSEVILAPSEGETASSPHELSYLYFIATGVLASGADSGAKNLYVTHLGAGGWSTTFIATLSNEDQRTEESSIYTSSRASANGRYLAFMSQRPLIGYDNTDAFSRQPDEEVYLYDAVSNHLVCVSCNPTGARPVGVFDENGLMVDRQRVWGRGYEPSSQHWLAGIIPNWETVQLATNQEAWYYQPRFLSDSGRVFFDSPDALVPQAINGEMDVYEHEPAGVGSCSASSSTFSATSGGCTSLISSGTATGESAFYDASESGDDAFFITPSKLVAEDYDTAYDVYDARVCSSSEPCPQTSASPPPCNSGDACKAAPSPQPTLFGPPASATFNGTGNVSGHVKPQPQPKPTRCAKGKVRKNGRCVKRKPKKRSRSHRARRGRAGKSSRRGRR